MSEVEIAKAANKQTHDALQKFYNFQNHGQKQKAAKDKEIKEMLEKHKVKMDDA